MTFPFPVFCPDTKIPVEINYADTAFRGSGGNWNTGTRNLGASTNAKIVVVATLNAGGSGTVAGVTVGGLTATLVAGSGANGSVGLWAVEITATSGDVVISQSGSSTRIAMMIWEVLNAKQLTPFHAAANTATSTSISASLNIPAAGAALAAVRGNGSGNVLALSAGVTVDITQNTFENGNNAYAGGSDELPAAQTGRTITATMSPSGSLAIAAASWEPA